MATLKFETEAKGNMFIALHSNNSKGRYQKVWMWIICAAIADA